MISVDWRQTLRIARDFREFFALMENVLSDPYILRDFMDAVWYDAERAMNAMPDFDEQARAANEFLGLSKEYTDKVPKK